MYVSSEIDVCLLLRKGQVFGEHRLCCASIIFFFISDTCAIECPYEIQQIGNDKKAILPREGNQYMIATQRFVMLAIQKNCLNEVLAFTTFS